MFIISKIFLRLTDPGVVVLVMLVIGIYLLWLRPKAGKWLLAITVTFCFIISTLPVGGLMIATLEDRFRVVISVTERVDGIIFLCGSVDQYASQSRKQIGPNNGAERLTNFVALVRQSPKAKLVFTGGSGRFNQTYKEAGTARNFFTSTGLRESRDIYEDQSRNTFENEVFTQRLIKPRTSERWILITSARHMPRPMSVFRQLG